jgi:hypothetical protein
VCRYVFHCSFPLCYSDAGFVVIERKSVHSGVCQPVGLFFVSYLGFLLRSVYIVSVLLGTQLQHAAFRSVPCGFFLFHSSFLIHSTMSLMPFDYG